MFKMIRTVGSALNRLTWLSEVLGEIALLILMILVFHEVVVRYILDSPTQFSVEISEYLLVFITFMCAGWVLHEDRHVRMVALVDVLPKKAQLVLDVIASIMIIIFCFVLVWKGGRTVIMAYTGGYHSSSLLNVPLWIPYSFIPLGAAVLALQSLVKIGDRLGKLFATAE